MTLKFQGKNSKTTHVENKTTHVGMTLKFQGINSNCVYLVSFVICSLQKLKMHHPPPVCVKGPL